MSGRENPSAWPARRRLAGGALAVACAGIRVSPGRRLCACKGKLTGAGRRPSCRLGDAGQLGPVVAYHPSAAWDAPPATCSAILRAAQALLPEDPQDLSAMPRRMTLS